jgi:uncharacterized protein
MTPPHPETRAGRLAAALDDFIRSTPDVEAAAVVSFDGLPMASALPESLEEDRLGAMSAALLSLGEQAAIGLGRGQLNQVFVEGEHGFVFLMSARDQAVLAVVARRTAKIGFMLFEMRRAADRIGRALEAPVTPESAVPPVAPPAPEIVDDEDLLGEPVPPTPLDLVRDHAPVDDHGHDVHADHNGHDNGHHDHNGHNGSHDDPMFGSHADLPPASSDAWTV